MFGHEGCTMVCAMCDQKVGIFEHLEIMAKTYVDQRVKYIQHILTGTALKKYCDILLMCKNMTLTNSEYQCTLGEAKDVKIELFWDWSKLAGTNSDLEPVSGEECCNDFEK